jgi:hypothetical protein
MCCDCDWFGTECEELKIASTCGGSKSTPPGETRLTTTFG